MAVRLTLVLIALFAAAFAWAGDRAIRPGDRLKVTCAEAPALTKATSVSRFGTILLEYLGAVAVEGLTTDQAADRIAGLVTANGVAPTATVTVALLESDAGPAPTPATETGVRVEGAVEVASTLPHRPGMRLSDVVRDARPLAGSDLRRVRLVGTDGAERTVDFTDPGPAGNPELNPGDRVFFGPTGAPRFTLTPLPGSVPDRARTQPEAQSPPFQGPAEPEPLRVVMVMGGVVRPGPVVFTPGLTVRRAIDLSGGVSSFGLLSQTFVERGSQRQSLDLAQDGVDAALEPDDRVVVGVREGRGYVQVFGAVRSEGYFLFTPGMRLADAVRAAGGPGPGASLRRVRVFREGAEKRPLVVDFEDIERGFAGDVPLQPGDRIEVPGRGGRRAVSATTAVGVAALWAFLGR